MAEVSITNEREIQPMQLSLEQLSSLKTQHENEIQELSRQMEALYGAKNRYNNAKVVLGDINTCPSGNQLMIPLNSSLYVPGKIVNPDKVVVELGTGYFCEKEIPEAVKLIDRKTQLINSSIESVESVTMKKRKNLEQITQIMQYKISQLQGGN
uniref:Prefoldin subunit 5 n=1 Tax=Spumella elongata TaxID=89044 RepID=A0A7S3HCV2_9STRA